MRTPDGLDESGIMLEPTPAAVPESGMSPFAPSRQLMVSNPVIRIRHPRVRSNAPLERIGMIQGGDGGPAGGRSAFALGNLQWVPHLATDPASGRSPSRFSRPLMQHTIGSTGLVTGSRWVHYFARVEMCHSKPSSVESGVMKIDGRLWLGVVMLLTACEDGFSDEDIRAVKEAIRSELSTRPGVTVKDVTIIKESPKRLNGFVKIDIGGFEVMKSCSADMGEGRQYIWKCE
jgi:hypothetical protein